jgi:hypothetical protein
MKNLMIYYGSPNVVSALMCRRFMMGWGFGKNGEVWHAGPK